MKASISFKIKVLCVLTKEDIIMPLQAIDLNSWWRSDWASPVAQMVKTLPAVWETQVQSLGWEDPLEKGNGYRLQYSCLENPMDRGAWKATVHGVAKTWTWLSDKHVHISLSGHWLKQLAKIWSGLHPSDLWLPNAVFSFALPTSLHPQL